MMKSRFLLLLLLLSSAKLAYAHGDDLPGPHGGIISMPSGFHSEIVPVDASTFKVYLLDFYFKDPMTRNSKVDGSYETKTKSFPIQCQPQLEYFYCTIQGTKSVTSGKLRLLTMRDGMEGAEISYQLPLQLHKVN